MSSTRLTEKKGMQSIGRNEYKKQGKCSNDDDDVRAGDEARNLEKGINRLREVQSPDGEE